MSFQKSYVECKECERWSKIIDASNDSNNAKGFGNDYTPAELQKLRIDSRRGNMSALHHINENPKYNDDDIEDAEKSLTACVNCFENNYKGPVSWEIAFAKF